MLVRVVNMLEMRWRFQLLPGWWRTYHNVDADYITRCTDNEFAQFCQRRQWKVVDVKEAVRQALEDSERFGACFLYHSDEADRQLLLQLQDGG